MRLLNPKGILGINARNLLYIKAYNPKKAIQLADNKIKTKKFLEARGVPVPKLIASISKREEAERFDFDKLPNSFVLKPNFGFGGEGIIPIANKRENYWITSSGKNVYKEQHNINKSRWYENKYLYFFYGFSTLYISAKVAGTLK